MAYQPNNRKNIEPAGDSYNYNDIYNLFYEDELLEAKAILEKMHYADFVDFLDQAPHKFHKKILSLVIDNFKPDSLVWLSINSKISVIETFGIDKVVSLLEQLEIQDAIDFIADLDEDTTQEILSKLSTEKQKYIIEGFTYPENTAGRVMEKQYVCIPEYWTIDHSIDYIRRSNFKKDFYAAIVVDSKHRPVGYLLPSTLLLYHPTAIVKDIMSINLKTVGTHTDLNDISYTFKHYALTIVPVISKVGKLVGTISIDNVLYILEEQVEQDIMYLAGVQRYNLFSNIFSAAKHRFPWLFFNLISAFLTAHIILYFESTIKKLVVLASIMPIVASMGGNAGTQVMTIVVRALSNKYINHSNFYKIVLREILICGFNGIILASIGFILTNFINDDYRLSLAFSSAVVINFIIAGILGATIPMILNSIKIDPAAGSGVLLTAFTDWIGFFTFLSISYLFLV